MGVVQLELGVAVRACLTDRKATASTADVFSKLGSRRLSDWLSPTKLFPVTLHRQAQQQYCKAAVQLYILTLAGQTDDVRIIEKVKQEVLNII